MILNESKIYHLNEVKSVPLDNGTKIYQYKGKYYIQSSDTKKEISKDQYDKLMKDTDELNEVDPSEFEDAVKENEDFFDELRDMDQDDPDYDDNLKDIVKEQSKKKKSFKNMVNQMMEKAEVNSKKSNKDFDEDEWVDQVCDFIKNSFDWIETYLLGDIF